MQIKSLALVAVLITPLAGCLNNDLERGIAGAGGGAVIAAVLDGNILLGAIVGGAGGVFCDDVGICR